MRALPGVCLVLLLSAWAGAAPDSAPRPTNAPPLPAFPGAAGDVTAPVCVQYQVSGDAVAGRDFRPIAGTITIPAGAAAAALALEPLDSARDNCTVVVTLVPGQDGCFVGCPAQSLIVIRR